MEMHKIKCAQCGANIMYSDDQTMVVCPQCGGHTKLVRARRGIPLNVKTALRRSAIALAVLALLVCACIGYVIPGVSYSLAGKREVSGDFAGAKRLYGWAGGHRDAEEKLNDLVLSHPAVGDNCYLGNYEQDDDLGNGMEPIAWNVIAVEDGRALLLSEYALDALRYHQYPEYVTWEVCSLRKWLNGDFFQSAFEKDDAARILLSQLAGSNNEEYNISGGVDTEDKVFLLSIEEIEQYIAAGQNIQAECTDYAARKGALVGLETGCVWWWLRSPGFSTDFAALVNARGEVFSIGSFVNNSTNVVRPAIWLDISKVD